MLALYPCELASGCDHTFFCRNRRPVFDGRHVPEPTPVTAAPSAEENGCRNHLLQATHW
ncbi:hypothetical protein OH492_19260 [Vibrio chagasii]|nr:hypothetical protein [Vibrio chagasii]